MTRAEQIHELSKSMTNAEIASHLGIAIETVSRQQRQFRQSRRAEGEEPTPGVEPRGPDLHVFEDDTHKTVEVPYLTTVEEMLEFCEVDKDVWEAERLICNKWDVTMKGPEGPVTKQNLQLKAFLRHKFQGVDFDCLKKTLADMPKAKTLRRVPPKNGPKHLLEINVPDLHYGSLCWAPESGENYDSKIAATRFLGAIEQLLSLSAGFNIEKIQFPIGSDYFNTDTPAGTTTAGTPQHNDVRWQKVYSEGVALLIQAIDMLRQVAPVEVILVQGNHDYELSYCAAHAISMHYTKIKNVCVDWGPQERKYRLYGDNLICYTHGKSANSRPIADKNWLKIITSEASKKWGDTKFHEVHCGHTHHQETFEDGALVVRHLGSLSGTTAYEYSSGYVGSRKVAHAFVWHAKGGPIAQLQNHIISK